MKKAIMLTVVMILLSSSTLAVVQRQSDGNQVTYVSSVGGSYTEAYWAVEDTVSCSISTISCLGSNIMCEYTQDKIRAVASTPDGGGILVNSITVTVLGSGTCTLDNGQYVTSTPGNIGTAQPISGSETLDLTGGACNTAADSNCDGCVHDSEFPVGVSNWKQQTGGITDTVFPNVVYNWKQQVGC